MPEFEHPIFTPEMKPKTVSGPDLVEFLDRIKAEVERDASMEGSITWSWGEKQGEYLVHAFVRTGNDMGQGGAMIVRDDD